MRELVRNLGAAFVSSTHDELLLAISEGFIKVKCAEAALRLGWTLQEGAGSSPQGPVADYLHLEDGNLVCRRGPRFVSLPEGSTDLTVVRPFQIMLEIKGRPDFGTKSQAQFQEMYADVSRIASDPKCGFLFVFDEKQYRSFSGEKTETRGRRASIEASWFRGSLPPLETISNDGVETSCRVGEIPLWLRLWVQHPSKLRTRVVVIGSRCEETF